MYVKRLKRKCGIRGCKNIDTYALSKSKEVGSQVIICKSCLEEALEAINNLPDEPKAKTYKEPPALFFNHIVNRPAEETPVEVPEEAPTEETPAEPTESATPPADGEYVCPHCGQVCKSELGLMKHIQAKHKDKA